MSYPRPLSRTHPVDLDYLQWIDKHLDSPSGAAGLFRQNEASRGNRPVTVTRRQLIDLWRNNGGSIDRCFGIKGSWIPKSELLLSIDKIDHKKGYEVGNVVIVLWRANDARSRYNWANFLSWRDALVKKWKN